MIPIYSSYYARVKNLNVADALLVQVSQTKPDWFSYDILNVAKYVAPNWNLIQQYKNGDLDFNVFGEHYINELNTKMQCEEFVSELQLLANENNCKMIILLCWEKDIETCHRFHLGRWLGENYSYEL